ncbi:MAG: SDR family NAD(P)-dependent oxidoreductase [Pseudomonadota bacterium]
MVDLNGKTALVTGASRGIGRAIAIALDNAGAKVIVHYATNREAAEETRDRLGDRCLGILKADLAHPEAPFELWNEALAAAGDRIDCLVNNAAIMPPAGVGAVKPEWQKVWDQVMRVNTTAAADLCWLALQHFQANGGGRIINIASRASHRGDAPDFMHYAASKAALVGITKTIARGFAKDNIFAFAIAPGFTKTEMARGFVAEYGEDAATADIPLGEMASTEEIGLLAAFLASDKTRSMTGATIDVNGASYVR